MRTGRAAAASSAAWALGAAGDRDSAGDVVAALRAGEIAGAGLDVFEQEPLPPSHPLWTLPNVLITPHTAGYGPYLDERRYAIFRDNCRALLDGGPFRNPVDKASWF